MVNIHDQHYAETKDGRQDTARFPFDTGQPSIYAMIVYAMIFYAISLASTNAAAAARPPITMVWDALRSGWLPVKRPFM
jgi:hypothetical protein